MTAIPQPEIAPQFAVHNPATQEIIGTLPNFSAGQVTAAVERAGAAQKRWASVPVRDRLKILKTFGELLCEQKDAVASVISREAGKPEAEALSTEILVVLDTVKYLRDHLPEFLRAEPVPHGNPAMKLKRGLLLPVVLELGGKDPMIVLEDADVDVASSAAVWGAFMNAGQTCLSVERCYVHEAVYEKFLERCVEKTGKLRVGSSPSHPLRPNDTERSRGRLRSTNIEMDIGPIIHERQLRIVQSHVEDAIARGARLLAGGKALPQLGANFFAPTILADVDHSMTIMREETFGPVLPVRSFKTEDEAVALANDSEFGLAASIFTGNRRRGEALARRIDAGTVMVNDVIACFGISEAPHGGVKSSGIGRTHGRFGLEEMVWPKYVDSDRMPGMKKPWWYGYGTNFSQQMNGFVELLFTRKLTNRLRGARKSVQSYLRRRVL